MLLEEIQNIISNNISKEQIDDFIHNIYWTGNSRYREKITLSDLEKEITSKIKKITDGLYELKVPYSLKIQKTDESNMNRKLYFYEGNIIEASYGLAWIGRMEGTKYRLYTKYLDNEKNLKINGNNSIRDFEAQLITTLNLKKEKKEEKIISLEKLKENFNKKFGLIISKQEIEDFIKYYSKKLSNEDKKNINFSIAISGITSETFKKFFNIKIIATKRSFIVLNKNIECPLTSFLETVNDNIFQKKDKKSLEFEEILSFFDNFDYIITDDSLVFKKFNNSNSDFLNFSKAIKELKRIEELTGISIYDENKVGLIEEKLLDLDLKYIESILSVSDKFKFSKKIKINEKNEIFFEFKIIENKKYLKP